MEASMFLAVRTRTALLAAAAVAVARSAVATEPAPTKAECIAASESGQDLRHAGKLNDARTQFAVCVAASCPGPIRDDCAQRLNEIGKATPSVVFEVKDATGNDVPGVAITMDGQSVAGVGTAIELDPGEHTFSFEVAGLPKIEKRLVIAEGVKQRREVVIMDPALKRRRPRTRNHQRRARSPRDQRVCRLSLGWRSGSVVRGCCSA